MVGQAVARATSGGAERTPSMQNMETDRRRWDQVGRRVVKLFSEAMTRESLRQLGPKLWCVEGTDAWAVVHISRFLRTYSCGIGVRLRALPGPRLGKGVEFARCNIGIGPQGICHALYGNWEVGDYAL